MRSLWVESERKGEGEGEEEGEWEGLWALGDNVNFFTLIKAREVILL